jgi:hypothetical protein
VEWRLSKSGATKMVYLWVNSGSIVVTEFQMPEIQAVETKRFSLFDTVPPDLMGFGLGSSFKPKSVQSFLSLKKEEVSRIAGVSPKSVRFEEAMTEADKAPTPSDVH